MKKKSNGFVLINTPVPKEDQEEDDRHFSVLEIHNKSTDWKAGLIMKQLYGSFEVGTMMELCNWLGGEYFEAETVYCFDIDDAEVDPDKSTVHMSHVIFKEDEYSGSEDGESCAWAATNHLIERANDLCPNVEKLEELYEIAKPRTRAATLVCVLLAMSDYVEENQFPDYARNCSILETSKSIQPSTK